MFSAKLLSAILVAATCLFILFSAWTMGMVGVVLPAALLIVLVLIGNPPALLLFFWGVTLVVPSLELVLPNVLVKIVEQGLALCLLAVVLGKFAISKELPRGTSVINKLLLILLAWIGVATIVNKVPARSAVFFVLTYIKPFWVFYFALTYLDRRHVRPFIVTFAVSVVLQIVFNVFYYLGLNPLPALAYRSFLDASIGTMGTCTHVAYLLIGFICVLAAIVKRANSLHVLLLTYGALLVAMIQFSLTYSFHAYPLLFGAVALQVFFFRKRSLGSVRRLVIPVLAIGIVMAVFTTVAPQNRIMRKTWSTPRLRHLWERTVYGIKGNSYQQVFLHASRYLPYPWVGGGPGNYTSNIARLTRRPLASVQHLAYRGFAHNRRQISLGGSIMTLPMTGLITLWGELGLVGFVTFFGAHLYALFRVGKRLRAGAYAHAAQQVLAEAFVPAMASFLVLNILVEAIGIMEIYIPLWIWAAVVWCPYPAEETDPERTTA